MKLKFILYVLISTILVILSNCQNSIVDERQTKANITTNSPKIKLKWLAQWYGEGKKETLIREIAREFTLLHQDIEIELEFPHQMAKINPDAVTFEYTVDTIVEMAKLNKWTYDIMLCDAGLYQRVGDSLRNRAWGGEFLVDFKEETWFVEAHKNNFFETKKNTNTYNGIAPGAYIEGVWNIFYLSSEVEKRLGIKIKTQNMNMSDFIAYARVVSEYNKIHADKITFFSNPQGNIMPFFNHLVMSALGKDSAYLIHEAIDALNQAYLSVEKLAPYSPLSEYVDYENVRALHHDKILFIYYPSWINLLWQKSNPEGEKLMYPCELPSIDNKTSVAYSGRYNSVFVVPKNSKNREAAELLMKFISSQETAEKWVKYSKCPTGLKNRISYSDFGKDDYTKFSQHINQKYQDKLGMVDLASLFFKTNKTIDFQVAKVMNGEITADEALNSVLRQVNAK